MHGRMGWGLVLIVLGGLLLLYNLHVVSFRYVWPAAIIVVGLYLIGLGWRRRSACADLSDFHCFGDRDYAGGFDIHGGHIGHFIGDVKLDLNGAALQPGENKITVSAFIGDIRIKAPADVPVKATCSAFIGDFDILGRKREGFFASLTEQTPDFDAAAGKRLLIICSAFIGDVQITRG
jgi:hypothetical protein